MLELVVGCVFCCLRPSLTRGAPRACGGYALPGSDSNGTQRGTPFEMLNSSSLPQSRPPCNPGVSRTRRFTGTSQRMGSRGANHGGIEGVTTTDEPTATHAHQVSGRIAPGSVSVTRVGPRMYEGLNERGATLRVGGPELEGEHFSPGELLKLALIACSGLSADRVTARRLGEDFALTVWAHGKSEHDTNRYTRIEEEFLLDLSTLQPDEREQLLVVMTKAIERGCTVARTIEEVVELPMTIDGSEV